MFTRSAKWKIFIQSVKSAVFDTSQSRLHGSLDAKQWGRTAVACRPMGVTQATAKCEVCEECLLRKCGRAKGQLPGRNVTCSLERMGHEESRSSTSRKQTFRTKSSRLDGSQSTRTERDAEVHPAFGEICIDITLQLSFEHVFTGFSRR